MGTALDDGERDINFHEKEMKSMPWDMHDYPSSIKNLNRTIKKKAIDIANALVDEGYNEGRAIPIATKQAKVWYNNASLEKRKEYVENADPTKRKINEHSRPELLQQVELIIPYDSNQWAVQSKDAKKPTKLFTNKADAVEYGKLIAKNKQTGLIIQKRDGSKDEEFNYSE